MPEFWGIFHKISISNSKYLRNYSYFKEQMSSQTCVIQQGDQKGPGSARPDQLYFKKSIMDAIMSGTVLSMLRREAIVELVITQT